MSRLRVTITVACLVLFVMAALPGASAAARSAEQFKAAAAAESSDSSFLGEILAWGRGVGAWLQALIAPEHGVITPIVSPPPPPALSPAP